MKDQQNLTPKQGGQFLLVRVILICLSGVGVLLYVSGLNPSLLSSVAACAYMLPFGFETFLPDELRHTMYTVGAIFLGTWCVYSALILFAIRARKFCVFTLLLFVLLAILSANAWGCKHGDLFDGNGPFHF